MFEDEGMVEKIFLYHDRLDGITFYPDLLNQGLHRNVIVGYCQCHEWPRILTLPEFPSSSVLTQSIHLR